ncbi:MAG: DUF4199 domain-containing protein [Cyclobacteriaceae bacterium]|jgi:hypothetical protein|nr:DUF4199 domain-containing protein [Cytophagales bacterium]MCZ8328888.1 DUF4199 domain-containing protein [Cyclobacteriaceae bacterium]
MENTTQTPPSLFQHALKHAAILGVISIVLTLAAYAIDYTLLVSMSFAFLSFAVYLGYGIYAGIQYRKENGGYLAFGKAFQHGFITFAISALISTVFGLLLYTVIDSELPAKLTEASMENAAAMMEKFGAPEDAIEEALAKQKEDTEKRFTPVGMLTGYVFTLIGCAIFALISGAVAKRKEPEMQ